MSPPPSRLPEELPLAPDELLVPPLLLLAVPLLLPLVPLLLPLAPLLLLVVPSSPASEPPVLLLVEPPQATTQAIANPITTRIDVFMAKLPCMGMPSPACARPRRSRAPAARRSG